MTATAVEVVADAEDLTIDQAYELIQRHITAITRLRAHISHVALRRERAILNAVSAGFPLSPAEARVAALLGGPLSLAEIGQQLHITENTVKTHTKNIYTKLGVHRRAEAIRLLANGGSA